jgi:hypothetical protein
MATSVTAARYWRRSTRSVVLLVIGIVADIFFTDWLSHPSSPAGSPDRPAASSRVQTESLFVDYRERFFNSIDPFRTSVEFGWTFDFPQARRAHFR